MLGLRCAKLLWMHVAQLLLLQIAKLLLLHVAQLLLLQVTKLLLLLLLWQVAKLLLLRSLLLLLLQAVASGSHGVGPPEPPWGAGCVSPGLQLSHAVSHRQLSLGDELLVVLGRGGRGRTAVHVVVRVEQVGGRRGQVLHRPPGGRRVGPS